MSCHLRCYMLEWFELPSHSGSQRVFWSMKIDHWCSQKPAHRCRLETQRRDSISASLERGARAVADFLAKPARRGHFDYLRVLLDAGRSLGRTSAGPRAMGSQPAPGYPYSLASQRPNHLHSTVGHQHSAPAAMKGSGLAHSGGLDAPKAGELSTHQLRHIVLRQQLLKPLTELEPFGIVECRLYSYSTTYSFVFVHSVFNRMHFLLYSYIRVHVRV